MKRKIISFFKKLRNLFYLIIKRPRIYYKENPFLEIYNFSTTNLNFYKDNSFTNIDMIDLIKSKIKH